jgi:hypothetical protein
MINAFLVIGGVVLSMLSSWCVPCLLSLLGFLNMEKACLLSRSKTYEF